MARMLIIGPPGSGKGTQAERISARLGVVAISTGDIFRVNVKGQTRLGLEARKYMDAGDFVPDSVTNKMLRNRLSGPDVGTGFMLDGYPRTVAQVDYLDQFLAERGQELDAVLQLSAGNEELVARLCWAGRRKPAALTTMRPSSATGWTSTTSRPMPLWISMHGAAS
jgi:adenylate kinase